MIIIWHLLNAWFRNIEHPEKYAIFLENIYGDPINMYGGRSWWKCNKCGIHQVREYLVKE